ncbi:hypothetical protein BDV24DRAFT_154934 [Aspergillus arachidicola]|uniref:Uncharacterized protein n=1 Tax=Aspergillus arachidicola TaxID=656916 RepID=A0A5N6XWU4_9EURO|nr:hypothetical protein BDV24DRAFT_154934 [Aspergillus arachidicola]
MASSRSSIITRLLSWRNILSILWLVPTITLLVLNFSGYIIGSGLACRGAACNVDASHMAGSQKAQMLDKGNRDVLGALLLVAKIIEIWFTFIAGGLLFCLAAHFSSRERVPMSLFSLYAEFLDFLYLQDLVKKICDDLEMETLTVPMDDMNDRGIKELQVTITTPVIANTTTIADRPTTGLSSIPSLQYIDINTNNTLAFERLLGGEKPSGTNVYSCTDAALAAGEYNCNPSFKVFYNEYSLLPPVLQEDQVSFTFNSSEYTTTLWAPLRQVLEALSTDYQDWVNATTSDYTNKAYPDSHWYNQSLDTQLQRDGPAIGVYGWCYKTNATQLVSVDTDKHVRCYSGITADHSDDPVGWGNATGYSSASFTLDQTSSMNGDIYATPKGRYLQSNSSCLQDTSSWNWDSLFSSSPQYNANPDPGQHADWYLAAWSVVANGTVSESTTAQSFISEFEALATQNVTKWAVYETTALSLLHMYISAFTTALILYETRVILTSSAQDEQKQREKESPFTNSMLTSKATVKMWQFKLGTATGTVGVVIMVIGIVVTIIQSLLYVFMPESPTDLVITALVHGEMDKNVTGLPMRVGKNAVIFPGRHD